MKNRRMAVNVEIGPFIATVGFNELAQPIEFFIVNRGKSGSQLDDILYRLGVAVSKIMQHEDLENPDATG